MPVFRRKQFLAACVLTAAALAGVPAQAATASAERGGGTGVVCGPPYVQDNMALGPVYLPRTGLLGDILERYVKFGGLSPQRFLDRYYISSLNRYRFPQDFGFAHEGGITNGRPLITTATLPVGFEVDRFGGETGAFLAPFGTPYEKRALPPSNLNTFQGDPAHPCNYHVYRVTKAFQVDAGPAASAFQQIGLGRQYHTLATYIPGAPANPDGEVSIGWLADNGYLARAN